MNVIATVPFLVINTLVCASLLMAWRADRLANGLAVIAWAMLALDALSIAGIVKAWHP